MPFIIVSGGRVHPFKTQYIEAVEMKHYMIDVLGIPTSAIIIDPFARHTTTNVRNAGHMIMDYGFQKINGLWSPAVKPILIMLKSNGQA